MSQMHPDTRAALIALLQAEIQDDPAGRGYAGKSAADEILALVNAPVPAATPAPKPCTFTWGEARGIAQSHGRWPLIVVRARGTPAMPPQTDQDRAILAAINAVSTEREQRIHGEIEEQWRAFTQGIQAFLAVGDLTEAAADAILALGTYQPPTPPDGPSRWAVLTDGLSPPEAPTEYVAIDEQEEEVVLHPGYAGPPNVAPLDLIEEALANA